MTTDFNELSQVYDDEVQRSIGFIGQDHSFFTKAKADHILGLATAHFGSPSNASILDVGCGIGLTDQYLVKDFAELHGIDVSDKEIERAKITNPSGIYTAYDGKHVPYPDDSFTIVFAINVFHHVPPADRAGLIGEMSRVTKPGGLSVIYEHNPYNPLTRLAVKKCAFDADAILLRRRETERLEQTAGLRIVDNSYILFFPVPGRALSKIEQALTWLPLGAQYCVAGRK